MTTVEIDLGRSSGLFQQYHVTDDNEFQKTYYHEYIN